MDQKRGKNTPFNEDEVKKVPQVGVKKVPLSNTHENNTQGVSYNNLDSHEDSKANPTTFVSRGKFSGGGSRNGSVKEAEKSGYKPLSQIDVYKLAKKYGVHPLDVRDASQSAIDEYEAGQIIKPTNTYDTTVRFLNYRVSSGMIERLGAPYDDVIERCHPLNKAYLQLSGLKLKIKSLKQSKQTSLKFADMLRNNEMTEGKTPMFLLAVPDSERLAVVRDRIRETNEEGRALITKYQDKLAEFNELKQVYPERYAEYSQK